MIQVHIYMVTIINHFQNIVYNQYKPIWTKEIVINVCNEMIVQTLKIILRMVTHFEAREIDNRKLTG